MVVAGGREPNFFFKIILPPILEDKKLRIPAKFAREFRNELSSTATLLVPAKKRWTVSIRSEGDDEFWFCDKLNEFFEFYSVSFGYFLLFHYRGNSEFGVRIFDLTACEISYPSNDVASHQLRSEEDANCASVHDDNGANCSSDDADFDGNWSSHDDDDDEVNCAPDDDDVVVLDRPNLVSNRVNAVELSSDDEASECSSDSFTRKRKMDGEIARSHVGDAEFCSNGQSVKSRNLQVASSIPKPEKTFRAIMTALNTINPIVLNIPPHIGRMYPRGMSGLVTLEISAGRSWIVQGNFLGGRLRSLGKGWADFARDTELMLEDECQFELITYDKEFKMKVKNYRKYRRTTR